MKHDAKVIEAYEIAKKARENAYAEYSKVKVGAALKVKGVDKIFAGCNFELIVNSISSCAERNAIGNIFTEIGKFELEFVVVCSNTKPALYPCGVCLQAMGEFCGPDLPIYISDKDSIINQVTFGDLLTHQYAELPKVLPEE